MLGIDVNSSRELQAVVLSIKTVDKDIQGNIRRYTKAELAPAWKQGLDAHAVTLLQRDVLVKTATVSVSNQGVKLKSATKGRRLPGGLAPKVDYAGVEFGASRNHSKTTYEATSRRGRRYSVTRHTTHQLPSRSRTGWVVYPTAADLIPRFASLWVQTVIKTMYDALDGGK